MLKCRHVGKRAGGAPPTILAPTPEGVLKDQIAAGIRARRLIEMVYDGQRRTVEPHVIGTRGKFDQAQVLVFQLENHSDRTALPGWRFFLLSGVSHVTVLEQTFPGRRPDGAYHHSRWRWIDATVT